MTVIGLLFCLFISLGIIHLILSIIVNIIRLKSFKENKCKCVKHKEMLKE